MFCDNAVGLLAAFVLLHDLSHKKTWINHTILIRR